MTAIQLDERGVMTKPFNGLSHTESEALHLLAEEAAEVIQAVTKVLRHGFESTNPHDPNSGTNRQHLEKEIGQLQAAVALAVADQIVGLRSIADAEAHKRKTMGRWLHHHDWLGVKQ